MTTRADRHLDHRARARRRSANRSRWPVEFADLLGERLHGANRRRAIRATMVTPMVAILTLYLPGPLIIASCLEQGGLARPERRGESTESVTAET
jgi:hypothetical protein